MGGGLPVSHVVCVREDRRTDQEGHASRLRCSVSGSARVCLSVRVCRQPCAGVSVFVKQSVQFPDKITTPSKRAGQLCGNRCPVNGMQPS